MAESDLYRSLLILLCVAMLVWTLVQMIAFLVCRAAHRTINEEEVRIHENLNSGDDPTYTEAGLSVCSTAHAAITKTQLWWCGLCVPGYYGIVLLWGTIFIYATCTTVRLN